jgi:hypothetical protein
MFPFQIQYGAVNACNILLFISEIHFMLGLFKHLFDC